MNILEVQEGSVSDSGEHTANQAKEISSLTKRPVPEHLTSLQKH